MARPNSLVDIASAPLILTPPRAGVTFEGAAISRLQELLALLSQRNGFYAFESALHVFPLGSRAGVIDLETWNTQTLWRFEFGDLADGLLFFAEDIFGMQFAIRGDRIYSFDPETAEVEFLADSISQWNFTVGVGNS
jgi:hypothetical protein